MSYIVDNAIIMAAGTSSRFAPLSYERPKALIEVKGEILIERQIRQLQEAGISQIIVVVGYKKDCFMYLKDKFNVEIIVNDDYLTRNNNGSIFAVKEYLHNSYICSSDNYFSVNPFEKVVDESYYAAVYAQNETNEWCMTEDEYGYIDSVKIGGRNAWYMLGHVFWDEKFSKKFVEILEKIYDLPETKDALWEKIFMQYLDVLKMKMRKYPNDYIFEFDTLDELRVFDTSYVNDTRSEIIRELTKRLNCKEGDLKEVIAYKEENEATGIEFKLSNKLYRYMYDSRILTELRE